MTSDHMGSWTAPWCVGDGSNKRPRASTLTVRWPRLQTSQPLPRSSAPWLVTKPCCNLMCAPEGRWIGLRLSLLGIWIGSVALTAAHLSIHPPLSVQSPGGRHPPNLFRCSHREDGHLIWACLLRTRRVGPSGAGVAAHSQAPAPLGSGPCLLRIRRAGSPRCGMASRHASHIRAVRRSVNLRRVVFDVLGMH